MSGDEEVAEVVNVAYRKSARQHGTYISAARSAVDGDNTTASCTDIVDQPWWAVDLARHYLVSTVVVVSPDVPGTNRK